MPFDLDVTLRIGDRQLCYAIETTDPILAVIGPSGAGKTSFLNAVAGLLRPNSGHISIAGVKLFDKMTGTDIPPEKRRAGYAFQDNRLFPHRNVRANLLFGARRIPDDEHWISLPEVCEILGIESLLKRWPATLSGGEARRVAIGRALLSAPKFLLLDEPLASLDAPRRDDILCAIERIRDELHLPMIYVSHRQDEVTRLTQSVLSLG